ncbi:MAG: hypothetical protein P8N50_00575 [Actinomycetota bacterium]|nr:hypothetical protein [Actinomycetota bacterium]
MSPPIARTLEARDLTADASLTLNGNNLPEAIATALRDDAVRDGHGSPKHGPHDLAETASTT